MRGHWPGRIGVIVALILSAYPPTGRADDESEARKQYRAMLREAEADARPAFHNAARFAAFAGACR